MGSMTDLPIACTLDANDLGDRLATVEALRRDALVGRTEIPGGVRMHLRNAPGIEARVRALAAAESRCCAFLNFRIETVDDELLLEITGVPEARPVIDEYFAPTTA
jgi:MerR family transcriptional regulator, copper efflux regulator